MTTTTHSTADVLDAHYEAALQSIRLASRDHELHREAAAAAEDPRESGFWQAQRDMAAREWGQALGAAAAIEQLADAFGVDLAHDRRRTWGHPPGRPLALMRPDSAPTAPAGTAPAPTRSLPTTTPPRGPL